MADTAQTQTKAHRLPLPLVRLEHLWVLVALSAIGVLISMAPTVPNDFWWHLKAGQLIGSGEFPDTNIFAWTLPADTPFIYQSWLGELLFYWLYQLGGLSFVIFARNMLGLGAFTLVAVEAQQRSGSWRLAGGAALLAMMMSINNLNARTQIWSWVPFALVLLLLGNYVRHRLSPRWLIVLPLLMVFWVNAHGGYMMGLLTMGAFVAGETLRRLTRQPRALNWQQLRYLYFAAAGMLAATAINPLGINVYAYVYQLLTDAPSQGLIVEWQPPDSRTLAGGLFFFSILVLIAAFAFARRRPTITDVILVCGFAWMGFMGVRYVVWFAMAAMPIAVQSFGKPRAVFVPGTTPENQPPPRRRPAGSPAINLALATMLALAVVAVQPWIKPALPLPQDYLNQFVDMPDAPLLFSAETPVAATEYLREEPCTGNLFNEMGYGSYMIWALYPEQKVFVDPRVELYPLEMWEDYASITRGRDVQELLAKYEIDCVMLDETRQPRLAETMPELSGWQLTYEDGQSEIWRRTDDV